jgi:SpoVK/Ycf46/Vps4 family AAA+-type ATPase
MRTELVDLANVKTIDFDEDPTNDLVLPLHSKLLLRTMFPLMQAGGAGTPSLRPRGAMGLFYGPSGSGKTFAAERIAELRRQPLLKLFERDFTRDLLFDRERPSHSLEHWSSLAVRWSALILVTDVDIILRSRDTDAGRLFDFLSFMNHYKGDLIITSSRPGLLDEAVRSKVTFSLRYEPLTRDGRARIWSTLLANLSRVDRRLVLDEAADFFRDQRLDDDLSGHEMRNVLTIALSAMCSDSPPAPPTTTHAEDDGTSSSIRLERRHLQMAFEATRSGHQYFAMLERGEDGKDE